MKNLQHSDDEFVGQTVKHLEQVKPVKKISNSSVTVPVIVDDVEVRVEPDTGADSEYYGRAPI